MDPILYALADGVVRFGVQGSLNRSTVSIEPPAPQA